MQSRAQHPAQVLGPKHMGLGFKQLRGVTVAAQAKSREGRHYNGAGSSNGVIKPAVVMRPLDKPSPAPSQNSVTDSSYNGNSNGNGHAVYNGNGNYVQDGNGSGNGHYSSNGNGQVVTYTVDANGRSSPYVGNGNGTSSTYTSNGNGNGRTRPNTSNGNGRAAPYSSNSNGNGRPSPYSSNGNGRPSPYSSSTSGNGVYSNGNGASLYSGNGAAANGAVNGNSLNANVRTGQSGKAVLAQKQIAGKQLMPGLRAMAANAAAALPSMRPSGVDSSNVVETIDLTTNQVTTEDIVDRPSDKEFKWAQDNYNVTQRTLDTWGFFTRFRVQLWLLEQKWSYPGGMTPEKRSARARDLAHYLLKSILELGPTFIKIGQLSSTRSDLFPIEFVEELAKLQDRVPAFSAEKAIGIIEQDLGQPINRLFKSFDPRPIAAASLGQVHRAVLFSGEQVVVKVQRPGLKSLFDIDLKNLRLLAQQLDKGEEQNKDWTGIYQECATTLYQEIDYINEGKNSDRFRRNFRDVPWVRVPVVHWEYSSVRVLTMEYLPGVKISSRQQLQDMGLNTDVIAQRATEAYLIQILKHGFYHADPHPGNVSVDKYGNLLYYDMGMMGTITGNVRGKLLDLFGAVYRKDAAGVVSVLVALEVIKPSSDMLILRRAVAYFLDNLARQTQQQETIAAIGEDLFSIAVDQPIRFPANFVFVLRAFSTLEGIGKTLNPDYKFAHVATPYAQELLQLQDAGSRQALIVSQVQQQVTELGVNATAMPSRIAKMDALLTQLESGDVKLRVRVLEAERAARRSGVMQAATMNVVGAMGFLNLGCMFALSHLQGPAAVALSLAGVFSVLMWRGFKRIERLDMFEKQIKG